MSNSNGNELKDVLLEWMRFLGGWAWVLSSAETSIGSNFRTCTLLQVDVPLGDFLLMSGRIWEDEDVTLSTLHWKWKWLRKCSVLTHRLRVFMANQLTTSVRNHTIWSGNHVIWSSFYTATSSIIAWHPFGVRSFWIWSDLPLFVVLLLSTPNTLQWPQ